MFQVSLSQNPDIFSILVTLNFELFKTALKLKTENIDIDDFLDIKLTTTSSGSRIT